MRRRRTRKATNIKSNNPHLAGGEKRVLSIWVFAIFAMRKRVDDGLLVSWFLKV